MGFNATVKSLFGSIDTLPLQGIIGFGRTFNAPPTGNVTTLTIDFGSDDSGNDTLGVTFLDPGITYSGSLQFALLPFRIWALDTFLAEASNIKSALANLSISAFSATQQTYTISWAENEPGGIVANYEGQHFDPTTSLVDTNPASLGLTMALFGGRYNEGDAVWELIPLGGADSFSFAATNNTEAAQQFIVNLTNWVKCYLANKNTYMFFAMVVVPATAKSLVGEIHTTTAGADAIWDLCVSGELTFVAHGHDPLNPTEPLYLEEGSITTTTMAWQDTQIQFTNIELDGNIALPSDFRISPYMPPMT